MNQSSGIGIVSLEFRLASYRQFWGLTRIAGARPKILHIGSLRLAKIFPPFFNRKSFQRELSRRGSERPARTIRQRRIRGGRIAAAVARVTTPNINLSLGVNMIPHLDQNGTAMPQEILWKLCFTPSVLNSMSVQTLPPIESSSQDASLRRMINSPVNAWPREKILTVWKTA